MHIQLRGQTVFTKKKDQSVTHCAVDQVAHLEIQLQAV